MFSVGDRVRTIKTLRGGTIPIGSAGTVREAESKWSIGIQFDFDFGGHSLKSHSAPMGTGWYCSYNWLELLQDPVECSAADLSVLFE